MEVFLLRLRRRLGDLLSEGMVTIMPSLIILETNFEKVMVTMNVLATMSMYDQVKEGGVDSLNYSTVLSHLKRRTQVNIRAKPKRPIFFEIEDLQKRLAALSRENQSLKTRRIPGTQYE